MKDSNNSVLKYLKPILPIKIKLQHAHLVDHDEAEP